jgi:cytochrome oxidase Cu insertion factor (SCO1/SenC/PrrC family)
MAFASTNPHADPIVTEAEDGAPDATNIPAPGFQLTDQQGRSVSLASLKGKTVALTFLDPVCTSDCPIIAQELREADEQLAPGQRHATEFVAIVANPLYRSVTYTDDFDRQEDLGHLANWLFLTGSIRALDAAWNDYGIQVAVTPAGSMVDHSDMAFVIDTRGRTRYVLNAGPGAGTSTTKSSFADLLDQEIEKVAPSP